MARGKVVEQKLANKGDAVDIPDEHDEALTLEMPEMESLSREEKIRLAAFNAAERRGFEPGHEVDDWLEAERSIDEETVASRPPG